MKYLIKISWCVFLHGSMWFLFVCVYKKIFNWIFAVVFLCSSTGKRKERGAINCILWFSETKETIAKALELFLLLLLLEKHDQNCGCLVAVSLWLQVGKKGFYLLKEGIIITATMWETMLGKGFKVSKWWEKRQAEKILSCMKKIVSLMLKILKEESVEQVLSIYSQAY